MPSVHTAKPVAVDSPDHLYPWGTARDNSISLPFNRKLLAWIPRKEITALDLGCAGGGFVRSLVKEGCDAYGIEGSDYSKRAGRAEWSVIPARLFTADITEPFKLTWRDWRMAFSLITAWEVMEHIPEEKVPAVLKNITDNLAPGGVVIMSISTREEVIDGHRLHLTVRPEGWWLEQFAAAGFRPHPQVNDYFGRHWVRSPADAGDAPGSFTLVMTRAKDPLPHTRRLWAAHGALKAYRRARRLARPARPLYRLVRQGRES